MVVPSKKKNEVVEDVSREWMWKDEIATVRVVEPQLLAPPQINGITIESI